MSTQIAKTAIPSSAQVLALHAGRRISEAEQERLYRLSMQCVEGRISDHGYQPPPRAA